MVNFAKLSETSVSPFVSILSYLIAVIFVLFLAYLAMKFLSRLQFGRTTERHIHLLDKFFVSADKSIFLVKVDEKFYLISSDKQGLRLLDKLDKNDINMQMRPEGKNLKHDGEKGSVGSFLDVLKSAKGKKPWNR